MVKTIETRPHKRDPLKGEFQPEDIPTVTVKKSFRWASLTLNKTVGSLTVNGTSTLRVTRLHLIHFPGRGEYALADEDGTIDTYMFGTANWYKTETLVLGQPDAPVLTIKHGTFNVYNSGGSQADGTYVVSIEGIKS